MIYGYEENVTIGDKLLLAMIGALCTIMHQTAPTFSFFTHSFTENAEKGGEKPGSILQSAH